jgi:hypothetical protein
MQFIIEQDAEHPNQVQVRDVWAPVGPSGLVRLSILEAGKVHAETRLTVRDARALAGALLMFAEAAS